MVEGIHNGRHLIHHESRATAGCFYGAQFIGGKHTDKLKMGCGSSSAAAVVDTAVTIEAKKPEDTTQNSNHSQVEQPTTSTTGEEKDARSPNSRRLLSFPC